MDMERHDFQLDDLVERIKDNDHRLVALQVPEGLKMQALEMMDSIEEDSEAKVVLAADPCYGACDLVHDKMRMMGVELVAHMGHSAMNIDSGMPTHFIPVTYDGDPEIDPVIPIFCMAFIEDGEITIKGDGETSRDFTFVENAVLLNELGLFTENKEALNQVYNRAVIKSL